MTLVGAREMRQVLISLREVRERWEGGWNFNGGAEENGEGRLEKGGTDISFYPYSRGVLRMRTSKPRARLVANTTAITNKSKCH